MQKQFMGVAALGAALAIGDASHAQAVQWRVEDGGNGHWYRLIVSGPIPWANARLACESLGGHLATPRSATEDSFILSISNRSSYPSAWVNDFGGNATGPWLGGYQPVNASPSQPWAWVTGEPWAWAGWAAGEPNGGFVPGLQTTCMLGYAWSNFYRGWADISSDLIPPYPNAHSYIVEWSADCNNDGIVDYGQCRDGSLPDYNGNNVPDCCESGVPCQRSNYPVQWRTEDGGNGHWYQLRYAGLPTSWQDCQHAAVDAGGHLATLTSLSESEWVGHYAGQYPAAWGPDLGFGPVLGGFQPPLSGGPLLDWKWVTGEPWSFTWWAPGEPNDHDCSGAGGDERYLAFLTTSGWNDIQDIQKCSFGWLVPSSIVEWSADCNADGIVDYGQILQGQLPDTNNNGVPDSCEVLTCANADLFRDSNVNGADLGILLSQWGPAQLQTVSDINRDGAVDGVDLGLLLSFWGPCPN
jgi:hypothetical protein